MMKIIVAMIARVRRDGRRSRSSTRTIRRATGGIAEIIAKPRIHWICRVVPHPPCPTTSQLCPPNTGSSDGSWSVVEKLAQGRPEVRGINLMRNYGQHNALLCGVRAARFAVIVTIDDDLQNPPEEIPTMRAKLNEGFDVVYGTPEKQH